MAEAAFQNYSLVIAWWYDTAENLMKIKAEIVLHKQYSTLLMHFWDFFIQFSDIPVHLYCPYI